MTLGRWRIAAASAIGSSHLKVGTPCQDAHAVWQGEDRDGLPVLAAVVSDGAGSASRAEIGSAQAAQAILRCMQDGISQGRKVGEVSESDARAWMGLVQECLQRVADEDNEPLRSYACTLLAVLAGEDACLVIQLGDGAVVMSDDDDNWTYVHWPQHGEYANTTRFMSDPDATEQAMIASISHRVDEFAVFSDGIEHLVLNTATTEVYAPFFDRMLQPVRKVAEPGLNETLSMGLEKYLSSPTINDRTSDDKTLILATRRAAVSAEP